MWVRGPVLWIPVCFFLQPPTLASPNGLLNKAVMVTRMEVMGRFSNMDLYSPRLACLQLLLSAQSARSTDQSPRQHHSLVKYGQLPSGRSVTSGHFHHRWHSLSSHWNTLSTGLPSLPATLLPKLLSMHLQNALSTPTACHTALFLVTNWILPPRPPNS